MNIMTQKLTAGDEVSLSDIWRALVRRKYIIGSFFCILLIASIVYLYFWGKLYESDAVVRVDYGGAYYTVKEKEGLLNVFINVIEHFKKDGFINDSNEKIDVSELDFFKLGRFDTGSGNQILITIRSNTSGSAKLLLQKTIDEILVRYKKVLLFTTVDKMHSLSLLENKLGKLEKKISVYSGLISKIDKVNPGQAVILTLEKINLVNTAADYQGKIIVMENSLSQLNGTQVLLQRKPDLGVRIIKTKYRAAVVASAILGLFLGVFVALLYDFSLKLRARLVEGNLTINA